MPFRALISDILQIQKRGPEVVYKMSQAFFCPGPRVVFDGKNQSLKNLVGLWPLFASTRSSRINASLQTLSCGLFSVWGYYIYL
jgi:hypothetical protein